MRYTICVRCYAVIPYGRFSCPSCDTLLEPKKMKRVKLCRYDGTPILVGKRFCSTCGARVWGWYMPLWIWLSILGLMSIVATVLLVDLHQYAFTTYRQETCIITNRQVSSSSDKSGTSYQPDFSYEVIQHDQHQIIDSSDSSLGFWSSSDQDSAQQIVDQYQVGSAYPCWYSSVASPDAMLMQPDVADSGAGEALIWLFCSAALLFLVSWCVMHLCFYPWGLRKRFVETTGTVVDHEVHQMKSGTYTVSIVEFQTQTEPPLKCRKKRPGEMPLRTQVNICYDWLHPAKNVRVQVTYTRSAMITDMAIGIFLILFLVGSVSTFFIWMAFQF